MIPRRLRLRLYVRMVRDWQFRRHYGRPVFAQNRES